MIPAWTNCRDKVSIVPSLSFICSKVKSQLSAGQARKADNDGDDRFFSKSYNYNTTDFRVEHAFAANDTQNSDSEYVFIAVMA